MALQIKKAVKHEAKLRMAIPGPAGSGKTFSGLAIGSNLGGKLLVVDTEHGSASKYADLFDFDVIEIEAPFHPDKFVEAIRLGESEGYSVILLDSLSHAWGGKGGILEIVDEIAMKSARNGAQPNKFTAWGQANVIQNRLVDTIVGSKIHVIATLRSKMEHVQEKDANNRTVIRKVGMAAQQRDGFEYEFDVVMDMDIDHRGYISKSRAHTLADKIFDKPGKQVATALVEWLQGAPAPVPAQVPTNNDNNEMVSINDIEAAGEIAYGGAWNASTKKRLAEWASDKTCTSLGRLTVDQLNKVMVGLSRKIDQMEEAANARILPSDQETEEEEAYHEAVGYGPKD